MITRKSLLKNPSKSGYLCTVFTMNDQNMREPVTRIVLVAKSREEAIAMANKASKYNPNIKYTLDYINIYS
jgi:hypothetical protein